jgi:hypothetical protein
MSAESLPVQEEEVSPDTPPQSGPKQERERSTIEFPYLSLDVAIEIVMAVHATGGQKSLIVQTAAHLDEKPNTGAFRNKLATARIFGLATYSIAAGSVALTPLGSRLTDPDQEKGAKAEAFLNVPLYRRIYDQYNGVVLPPTSAALETALVSLGVAAKQKDKARQAFQRSAQQAGFFAYGTTKLVYPVLSGKDIKGAPANGDDPNKKSPKDKDEDEEEKKLKKGGSGEPPTYHPFIAGLLETLPPTGVPKTEWTLQGRQDWLQTAAGIFNLIYKTSAEDKGTVTVSLETPKNSAN